MLRPVQVDAYDTEMQENIPVQNSVQWMNSTPVSLTSPQTPSALRAFTGSTQRRWQRATLGMRMLSLLN